MERTAKPASESFTVQTQIVLYSNANGAGRLFGGQLMSWMDIVGAVAARRHSGHEVLTASVDSMSFLTPAQVNDTIVIEANLTKVGTTSMHTNIIAYVERLNQGREVICSSTFVYVAMDDFGRPTPVPYLREASLE